MTQHDTRTVAQVTAHGNLVAALAAFHTEAVKVVKDATAKVTGESRDGRPVSYSYGYADLATVAEAVNPLLGKHGLAFISKPTMTPQGFGLVYKLAHEGGEAEEGFWPLPDPTRVKPQEMGSWITYWRRYALLAVTNTFPSGEDDDGAAAGKRESWDNAQPRQQQPQEPPAAPQQEKTSWTDDEMRELFGKIETVEITGAVKGYDWMASKNLHQRQVEIPTDDGPQLVTASDVLAYRLADLAAKPEANLRLIALYRAYAEDRGLLKISVSESTTLDEELAMARDLFNRRQTPASGDDGSTQAAVQGTGD